MNYSFPEYTDEPYVTINNNQPFFTEEDRTDTSFELYSELDDLGIVKYNFEAASGHKCK